jgi:hypothetical protein
MVGSRSSGDTCSAFNEACATVRRLLADAVREDVRTRHKVGVILIRVHAEANTYGECAIERMAEELATSTHILYSCARVAECWSKPQITTLSARTNARGEPLSWSHFVVLTKPAGSLRGAWIERCLAEGWTVRELREQMAQEGARNAPDLEENAGARAGEPFRIALREGLQHAARATAQFDVIREGLLSRQDSAGIDTDEDLRARAIEAYEKLAECVDETLDCLREMPRSSEHRLRVAVPASVSDEPADVEPLLSPQKRSRAT